MDKYAVLEQLNKLFSLVKQKERDIENRKTALLAKIESNTNVAKVKDKLQNLEQKKTELLSKENSKTKYYYDELKSNQDKWDRNLEIAKNKMEKAIKEAEDRYDKEKQLLDAKHEHYRNHLQTALDNITNNFETKKDFVDTKISKIDLPILDEDSDIVLTKMKGELKDLEKKYSDQQELYVLVEQDYQRSRKSEMEDAIRKQEADNKRIEREEQLEREKHFNEMIAQREKDRVAEQQRYEDREKQAILQAEEEKRKKLEKQKEISWRKTIKEMLSENQYLYNHLTPNEIAKCKEYNTIKEAVDYILSKKNVIDLTDELEDKVFDNEPYFTTDITKKYDLLQTDEKRLVAMEPDKDKQIKLVVKLSRGRKHVL